MHHQGLDRPGDGLTPTAWAEDGCIEGAEMRGRRFVVGVQWHPEEMVGASEEARRLFAGFVAAARETGK
jgi:gamma-glutamyl-gamma-aminobutyrate hydrolase PuuD